MTMIRSQIFQCVSDTDILKEECCSHEGQFLRDCERQVNLTAEIKCTILSCYNFNFCI
jgi:hypothetical protein